MYVKNLLAFHFLIEKKSKANNDFFFLREAALTFRWRLMLTLLNYKTYLKSDAKSLYDTSTAAVLV